MEDERGAGGHGDSGGPSEAPLSGKLADESGEKNMGCDNQVEEVFEEADGEEIMVEVMGSDVYVDGVSGNGEGDSEMAEAGVLEGGMVEKHEELTDVPREGDGNKMAEEVDTSLSMSFGSHGGKVSALPLGGVGDEVSNRGNRAVNESSREVLGFYPMKTSEEKETRDEQVDNVSDLVTPESSNHPVEVVSDDKADNAEEKEVFPSSHNSISHDCVAADSAMYDGETKEETHDGSDGVDGQVHSVNASGLGELLDSGTQKDGSLRAEVECPRTDGDCGIQENSVLEKDVNAVESKDSILKPDTPTDVPDEIQNCSEESNGEKNDQTDGASQARPESIYESSGDKGERGNDESLNTEGDLESHRGQHDVISSTPIQLADGGDGTEVNKDDRLNVNIKDDDEENVQTNISSSTEKEIVQSDLPVIATTVEAEDGSGEKGKENNPEILAPAQDDSAENMHLLQEDAHSKVKTPDAVVTKDPSFVGFATDFRVCGSPQSTKEVAALQITEASTNEADNLENTDMIPNEITNVAANSDTAQFSDILGGAGNTELLVSSTDISLLDGGGIGENSDEVFEFREEDEMPRESNGFCDMEGHTTSATPMDVEERESDRAYHGGPSSESDEPKMPKEERVKYKGSLRMKQSGYLMPPENEGCFATSDLVWGKVRSHPWWPGQIFDPADASEKAVKHHKKDSYLVAYFGDQTFAWNDSSALKPFRSYFSKMEKENNSESFEDAVDCTLEEVERRIQLGLSCSCIQKDEYAKIEAQIVENAGILEESSRRYGLDQSSCATHFEPNELLEFIRAAAPCASSGADRLDLVIARAQLSAFCSFKGYRLPIQFPLTGELLEIDGDTAVASQKQRHIPKDCDESRKERSLLELMGDGEYSPDVEDESPTGKKRKAIDPLAEGSEKRVSVSAARVAIPTSQAPKPSFKIGECIRRVANQLVKGDEMVVDGSPSIYQPSEKQSMVASAESLSVNDMLSQLELVALDPKKRHHNEIRSFFMAFRSSTVVSRRGRKKRSDEAGGGNGEEFEFDDVNDSYWTDRIVQNYSAEQLLRERMDGAGNVQALSYSAEKSAKAGRKPHSRKRYSMGHSPTSAPEIDEKAKRMKQEGSPAELILKFAVRNRIPSEINLNKMFRRFGPLMESETEVDHESCSAKVIFKRGLDAEVARNSAEKFSIFGPVVVSYEIGYSPVISVKILPVTMSLQSQEEATLML